MTKNPKAPCTPAADYRTDEPREDGWTGERMAVFLMVLAQTGIVASACTAAEMSAASAYSLRRDRRGRVFALGWRAALLLARDVLEDQLLALAITGVETVTTRLDHVTHRRALNTGLSMAVLNRLDRRATDLSDGEMALARSVANNFEAYMELIVFGGDEEALAAFLIDFPDPLAAQVAAVKRQRGEDEAPREAAAAPAAPTTAPAIDPKLVEESAIFSRSVAPERAAEPAAIAAMAKRCGIRERVGA